MSSHATGNERSQPGKVLSIINSKPVFHISTELINEGTELVNEESELVNEGTELVSEGVQPVAIRHVGKCLIPTNKPPGSCAEEWQRYSDELSDHREMARRRGWPDLNTFNAQTADRIFQVNARSLSSRITVSYVSRAELGRCGVEDGWTDMEPG